MRRGSDLSRPLTTPERTSRRHAPTPLTETESSRSINPPTVQNALGQRCEKESFEAPEVGVEKETLRMTLVDQEGHISSLGRGKKSRSEQKRS
ncbi:hypothetical protein CDAR_551451 [Caerostris darwini]|uniref:Uncharacterized protein n=1 Tax=Caerostris darwini TaxID=1538125 RepID=A0AAV4V6H0_9ARAC|nr:hypothetical protein CDAR_551451 [Caerostris darwini]